MRFLRCGGNNYCLYINVCYNRNLNNKEQIMELKNIHVQLDMDLYEQVKKLADNEKRTFRATLQILLSEALEAKGCEA